ncbi:GFA family protein [Rhodobacteraceae bacterium KMM 6894]|nr:GFA family protein [Rhodobacteraceae bacterium KMM 6894]
MPVPYTGGCLCGAIRFSAAAPPDNPHTCSCSMCQRHSGALALAWVEFPADAVTWTGPGGAPATYRSSEMSSRAFCPTCGSTLGAIDDASIVAVTLGCFDQPGMAELKPIADSHPDGRPEWWHAPT